MSRCSEQRRSYSLPWSEGWSPAPRCAALPAAGISGRFSPASSFPIISATASALHAIGFVSTDRGLDRPPPGDDIYTGKKMFGDYLRAKRRARGVHRVPQQPSTRAAGARRGSDFAGVMRQRRRLISGGRVGSRVVGCRDVLVATSSISPSLPRLPQLRTARPAAARRPRLVSTAKPPTAAPARVTLDPAEPHHRIAFPGFELDRQDGWRRAEREPRLLQHLAAEDVVAHATDRRPDAERDRLADDAGATSHGELPEEHGAEPVDDAAHDRPRHAVRDELPPVHVACGARPSRLAGELAHEVDALTAEHEGHHERARPVGVLDGDAVHLGDGLREECGRLEEPGGLHTRQRERHTRADAGHDGRCADRGATGRDRGEVAAFEDAHDLVGRRVRESATDAPKVRHDDRTLDVEQGVDAALHPVGASEVAARSGRGADASTLSSGLPSRGASVPSEVILCTRSLIVGMILGGEPVRTAGVAPVRVRAGPRLVLHRRAHRLVIHSQNS